MSTNALNQTHVETAPAAVTPETPAPTSETSEATEAALLAMFAGTPEDGEPAPAAETPPPETEPEAPADPEADTVKEEPPAAPEPVAAPPAEPEPDPLEVIERARLARLQEQQTQQQAKAVEQTKSQAQQEYEAKLAELEADRQLMLTDPDAFAAKHNLDRAQMLERFVAAGANPVLTQQNRAAQGQLTELQKAQKEAADERAANKALLEQIQAKQTYDENVSRFNTAWQSSPTKYPALAAAPESKRLQVANELALKYADHLGEDPFGTLANLVDRKIRSDAEAALAEAKAILAGTTSGATAETTSGGTAPAPGQEPAPVTITNELAAETPGKRPPPQTDEEQDAHALKIFESLGPLNGS